MAKKNAGLKKVKVGVIGCGNISGAYFSGMKRFGILDVVACADLELERAQAQAANFEIPRACPVKDLLADDAIELVVNLTVPKAHAPVNLDILAAGKSLHVEKPWATNRQEGAKVVSAAKAKKLLLGAAPDTFMGGGIQTARKLLDDGRIGQPVAATAFLMLAGHETWHPSPEFYYEPGGGPLFDMGPYYLHALINLLGPVKAVTAMARASFPTRLITSQPKYGKVVKVETPTHITASLEFASGVLATIIMSFDVKATRNFICLEVFGAEGSIQVPDPNTFGGPVRLYRSSEFTDWTDMALTHGNTENTRGIGPADMAYALRTGRPHRASGELGYHTLDIMQSILEAAKEGKRKSVASTCARPAALPIGLSPGTLD